MNNEPMTIEARLKPGRRKIPDGNQKTLQEGRVHIHLSQLSQTQLKIIQNWYYGRARSRVLADLVEAEFKRITAEIKHLGERANERATGKLNTYNHLGRFRTDPENGEVTEELLWAAVEGRSTDRQPKP